MRARWQADLPGYSANLGFLWRELQLPDAIRAAASAGFSAVECHWPYHEDIGAVRAALSETGLPMIALNTPPGDLAAGDFGLCALPGRESEALKAIEDAIGLADALGAQFVHVMAGKAQGSEARKVFLANLRHALEIAAPMRIDILIEPINAFDAPGYHFHLASEAAEILAQIDHPALRIMLDCYHVARMGEYPLAEFRRYRSRIGHVQIAGVPSRNEPDGGIIDFAGLIAAMRQDGWSGPIGAEYRPSGATGDSLGWLRSFPAV